MDATVTHLKDSYLYKRVNELSVENGILKTEQKHLSNTVEDVSSCIQLLTESSQKIQRRLDEIEHNQKIANRILLGIFAFIGTIAANFIEEFIKASLS